MRSKRDFFRKRAVHWPPPWLLCPKCEERAEYRDSKRGRPGGYFCECGLRVYIKKQGKGKLPCAPARYDVTFHGRVTRRQREAVLREWKEARTKARKHASRFIYALRTGDTDPLPFAKGRVRLLQTRAFAKVVGENLLASHGKVQASARAVLGRRD